MLNIFRKHLLYNVRYEQIRQGHRIRGKSPEFSRTIRQRLDEINYKDELYTTRIDIGLPRERTSENVQRARLEHVKMLKNNNDLEYMARNHKLEINLEDTRKEWLQTLGPQHKKQIADHYGVFEHLYGEGYFIPYVNMEIHYDLKNGSTLPVYTGNVIKPSEALEKPMVMFKSEENSLWTLVLTSLDGHLTENNKEYVHWLVANIPGNSVGSGDTLVDYLQPFPLKGTGYHRYVFVLYKQTQKISYELQKELENRTFQSREWYQKHQDNITPCGLAFYQTDWDHTVKDFFHNVLNKKEPVYEYDFPSPYIRPQEWFPLRKPFNLYMDKYRDPQQINKEYLLRKLKKEDPFKTPPPPLRFPNAQPLPHRMPSWLKLHEKKIRLGWGRVNDV